MLKNRRLIVFFVPPEKMVNGGIMSIFSICETSRQFKSTHHADVVMATFPGTKSYRKNDLFRNSEVVHTFDELTKHGPVDYLQLHIPEYASSEILTRLGKYRQYLSKIPELSINILNQNILLMPEPVTVASWFTLTPHVTQTTAHDKYSSQKLADQYNLPTHHLSTYVDPSQYQWRDYGQKENIIVLSPDAANEKSKIIHKLKRNLPGYKIITVKNMSYEEYKDLISRAKFTLTFGEGMDNYFIETFFSGGLAFAVYNEDFFPDSTFSKMENLYESYPTMLKNIVADIKRLDSATAYKKVVGANVKKLADLYSFDSYKEKLKNFYLGNFAYTPSPSSAERLIGAVVAHKNAEYQEVVRTKDAAYERDINVYKEALSEKEQTIRGVTESVSWKVTEPLRKLSALHDRKPK